MQFILYLIFTFLLLVLVKYVQSRSSNNKNMLKFKANAENKIVPWIGILHVDNYYEKDKVAGIVMIAEKYAIGNANDIQDFDNDTLRERVRAIFYNTRVVLKKFSIHRRQEAWESYVDRYHIHPGYRIHTINTLALLKLEPTEPVPQYYWQPIGWPQHYYNALNREVYTFGYYDRARNKVLEQVVYAMEPVDKDSCKKFYEKENINFLIIWPSSYHCFREKAQVESCLYESGLVVATNSTGNWTLIGIGTYGPGCTLPSRFIAFYSYLPWIHSVLNPSSQNNTTYQQVSSSDDSLDYINDKRPTEHVKEGAQPNEVVIELPDFSNTFLTKISTTFVNAGQAIGNFFKKILSTDD